MDNQLAQDLWDSPYPVLEHPFINDGIRHITVKDTETSYELVNGEWVERKELYGLQTAN